MAKSLISYLNVLWSKYDTPSEVICDAYRSFRSMANLSPWPGLKFRPSAQIEQLNNFVESVIKTFKSIDLMLNVANLLAREL